MGKFKRLFAMWQSTGSSGGAIRNLSRRAHIQEAAGCPEKAASHAGLEKQNLIFYNNPKTFSLSILRKGAKR
jgi:hypothetical protein